jgi:hypothetical protein
VAATGSDDRPRAGDRWGLVRVGAAVAWGAAFLAVFWRLLNSWDNITGASYGCSSQSHPSSLWVPGTLALLAGAGLYALFTPPHRLRYAVWSGLFAVALGVCIYGYALLSQLGPCVG